MSAGNRLSNPANMAEKARMSGRDTTKVDEALLDGVRQGDRRAWREFVARYEGPVAATVTGMIGRGPDAEDVGQEVFVRFFRNVHSFRGDANVATYLTRSAINLSLNVIKRRQRMGGWFGGSPDVDRPSSEAGPDHHAESRDTARHVSRAILGLKPDHRAVVVLRLVRDLSTRETAQTLGIPEGTVMSRLTRAQRVLRDRLRQVSDYDG